MFRSVFEIIQQRRSVRSFIDKPVERDKIERCLEAARLAPSACNSQPWSFIVVDDKEKIAEIGSKAFNGVHAMNAFCRTAPALLVVVSERSRFVARIGAMFRGTKFYLLDIGAAVEHFVLTAEELDLGTCWVGWFDEKWVKKSLSIPANKKVDVIIAFGYHEFQKAGEIHNRVSLNDIVSYNSWYDSNSHLHG